MQSSIHYFGLLLDYLELLCYVSFQQPKYATAMKNKL